MFLDRIVSDASKCFQPFLWVGTFCEQRTTYLTMAQEAECEGSLFVQGCVITTLLQWCLVVCIPDNPTMDWSRSTHRPTQRCRARRRLEHDQGRSHCVDGLLLLFVLCVCVKRKQFYERKQLQLGTVVRMSRQANKRRSALKERSCPRLLRTKMWCGKAARPRTNTTNKGHEKFDELWLASTGFFVSQSYQYISRRRNERPRAERSRLGHVSRS